MLENISLKTFNTFGIDAKTKYLVRVTSVAQLQEIIQTPRYKNIPKLILGGGSNLLFTKDFEGLVLKMEIKGKSVLKEDETHVWLKAMSGEVWHDLVLYSIEQGWGGIENLSLIPGLLGAAPMQNIGAYGVELKQVFVALEAIHMQTGEMKTFTGEACNFGYRESIFKKGLKGEYCIVSVTLQLMKKPVLNTSYGAISQMLEEKGVEILSVKAVSDAVIEIRQSKLPDPAEIGNAGSFFKNPVIEAEHFQKIKSQYPQVPSYDAGKGKIKVPAGWLIEQCGWKGKVIGQTGAHKNQALVLVNYGEATGKEIEALSLEIQNSVAEKFGIHLHPEVNII